jgi:hypothetical protein
VLRIEGAIACHQAAMVSRPLSPSTRSSTRCLVMLEGPNHFARRYVRTVFPGTRPGVVLDMICPRGILYRISNFSTACARSAALGLV